MHATSRDYSTLIKGSRVNRSNPKSKQVHFIFNFQIWPPLCIFRSIQHSYSDWYTGWQPPSVESLLWKTSLTLACNNAGNRRRVRSQSSISSSSNPNQCTSFFYLNLTFSLCLFTAISTVRLLHRVSSSTSLVNVFLLISSSSPLICLVAEITHLPMPETWSNAPSTWTKRSSPSAFPLRSIYLLLILYVLFLILVNFATNDNVIDLVFSNCSTHLSFIIYLFIFEGFHREDLQLLVFSITAEATGYWI